MIKKRKDWGLIIITIFLFIIPMFLAILTSYTLYLKYKIRNLEIQINELKTKNVDVNSSKIFNMKDITLNIEEINKFLNIKPKGIIEKKNVDIYYLIKNAKSSFKNNDLGGLTILNKNDAFFNSVNSIENNINYFLTPISTTLYTFYSENQNFNTQTVYTIQLRLYLTEEDAFFTALTLRNAGIPVFVYNGRFKNSGKNYFAICAGLFTNINDAKNYMENYIDEENILQLTGLSVKDRFIKSFNLIGNYEE
ncbi:hypothetical protein [Marinitoga sp. 38H-ov]|uniref:hypothetical protein n=1 Tax=Marinitoga sp. 38H-ov TaxID=1755814 RepID=UPI0013EBB885|nr:hypothetical protein [Marinitoga sp. 38H-ov]KAF2955903.1 hypothetical protein AS160_08465 [Marinitoga sp. 38H-ov]